MGSDWAVEPVSEVTTRMRINYRRSKDWEFWVLCTADRHIDHALSDLDMQKRHLELAKDGGWPVVDIGDLFCGMQGKFDPRSTRKALLACLNEQEEYLDALVDYAERLLLPYADCFAMLGLGNHETSQLRRHETHLLQRLVKRFQGAGSHVVMGGYAGWLRLLFEAGTGSARKSVNIRYTHGSGGNAPVTKGTIQTNRRAVVYPDANIVLSGHTHEQWTVPLARLRINDCCREYRDEQLHVQIPSYKDEMTCQPHGWAVEKGFSPKPTGAMWLKFWYDGEIKYDAIRAM